jgi:hypothetical protein
VVSLGFLHATLPVFVIEEVEYSVERLLGIIQHVSERSSLTVLKKIMAGEGYLTHRGLRSDGFFTLLRFLFCTYKRCTYKYCISIGGKGKGQFPGVCQKHSLGGRARRRVWHGRGFSRRLVQAHPNEHCQRGHAIRRSLTGQTTKRGLFVSHLSQICFWPRSAAWNQGFATELGEANLEVGVKRLGFRDVEAIESRVVARHLRSRMKRADEKGSEKAPIKTGKE